MRDYIQQNSSSCPTPPDDTPLLKPLMNPPDSKHLVFDFVGIFTGLLDFRTDKIKQSWEEEMNIRIENEIWDKALASIGSCSVNARLQLIQYEMIHRLHYSKVRLHKILITTVYQV